MNRNCVGREGRQSKSLLNQEKGSVIVLFHTFRFVREALGLTQQHIAERIKINQGSIHKYEAGMASLSKETLIKIAREIHINPAYVLGNSSEPFKSEELIKMFVIGERAPDVGIKPITEIVRLCGKIDILSLIVDAETLTRHKVSRHSLLPKAVCAVAMKDGNSNYFIVRRKKPEFLILLDGDLARVMDTSAPANIARFWNMTINLGLYEKIQDWNVSRKDIERLFSEDAPGKFVSPSNKELSMISLVRERNLDLMRIDDIIERKIMEVANN